MNIDEVKQWADTQNISCRIIGSFKKLLQNYELDDPIEYAEIMDGIDKEKLRYNVHTVSLNLGNWPECSYNTVSASMRVFFCEKQIANYSVYYLFSGEVEDDIVEFL
ncbi:hypothetical protein CLHUN_42220 [Ruminiclostridium hungatei]|uniref:Uncharacterized protein n=1 Tax=Ruminiclostridium hungatei TaxID=48256 RepID=A0A1V4SDI3_RUMHU|nr:hypothetical protein [Ruminiclostridium hungatei]OPX41908.1 hypothetical protein CLHUN_42220 [Ruminiclostridium hungatei]